MRRRNFKAIAAIAGWCACVVALNAASVKQTQSFLRDHRHAWLPYPFPDETATRELTPLLQYDFDIVDLSFVGSYHGGQIDFAALDAAVRMIEDKGKSVVLTLTPRFDAADGVFDRLSDGSVITNVPYKNPNASMIDVFDPAQREKYCDYIERCVRHYDNDSHLAGFIIGWGYMGETGYFIGDYLSDFNLLGHVQSGYSAHALEEFNRWRTKMKLPTLAELPLPKLPGGNVDFALFQRFRCDFAGDIFQKEAIARAKKFTDKPVGTWGYISVNGANYGRNWARTPNADFYRSAVSAASFDMDRTLLDSGMGYEDHEVSDGPWSYTVACVECALARQIAHGAVVHAMPIRDYEKPPWETNFFPRIAAFVEKQKELADRVRPARAEVALFQPTWSYSILPARNTNQMFVPRLDAQARCEKMIGLVESFGLPYRLLTENDLLDTATLRRFRHVIVPMWDFMPEILGANAFQRLAKDGRVVPIANATKPLARSEFRQILRVHGIDFNFDFDSEKILAGRVNNLIFNWNDEDQSVRADGRTMMLKPMEYRFMP